MRDIADEYHDAIDHLDRQIVEIFNDFWRVIEVDRVLVGTYLLGADRRDQVLPGEGIADVVRRETVGTQRVLVEVDLYLPGRSAIGVGQLGARDRRQRGPDEIRGKIVERGLGERVAGQCQLDDRNASSVVNQQERRGDAGRKLLQDGLGYRRDLRLGGADVDRRLEDHFDDAAAGRRL